MKRKLGWLIGVLWLAMAVALAAQTENPRSGVSLSKDAFQRPTGFLDHLLDPSKFSMSHSYSLSYVSFGKQGSTQGLYLNTMNYRFSDPLLMQVRIGYLHQPFGGPGHLNAINNNLFLQRAMLQYRPSTNFSITVDYQVLPSPMVYPYHYW